MVVHFARGRLLSLLTLDVRRPHVAEIRFSRGPKTVVVSTRATDRERPGELGKHTDHLNANGSLTWLG
jgi:hypothetical protein